MYQSDGVVKPNFLIKELTPRKVIIMDNASFHYSVKTRVLIESAGCELFYLPSYSKWGVVKKIVRGVRSRFDEFSECLDYVLCCT